MAKFIVTVLEAGVEAVSFQHETALPHFTSDDEEAIYATIKDAVAHLGMEP